MDIKTLAERLNKDLSATHKLIKRHNIETSKFRTGNGQLASSISDDDASRLIEEYNTNEDFTVQQDVGFFYIIALVPDLKPSRLKFGFANDVARRLSDHRCAAPTATILTSFKCERCWEQTAIAAITSGIQYTRIGFEVYDVEDVDKTIERASRFFMMMVGD